MDFFYSLHLGLAKFQFLGGSFDVGASGCNLLGTRSADEFIESCLLLGDGGFSLGKSGGRTTAVLFDQYLPCNNGLAFGDMDRRYRFVELGRQFDPVRCHFPDHPVWVFGLATCGDQERDGDECCCIDIHNKYSFTP